jgi:arginine-tRNA-protein transferase
MSGSLRGQLQFFHSTRARPCPYLQGRFERSIAAELEGPDAQEIYDTACKAGFRRSHGFIYRPACPSCDSCVPVRVVARDFTPKRTLLRIRRANADLTSKERTAHATREQYALFMRYQRARHASDKLDSGMDRMSFADYTAMVEESPIDTRVIEHRLPDGTLIAGMLCDRVADGLSAVYSYFTPDTDERSLGTFMILDLIARAQRDGLPYVYLGYWIADTPKMSYKTRFRPIEALGPDGWGLLSAR